MKKEPTRATQPPKEDVVCYAGGTQWLPGIMQPQMNHLFL